VDDPFTNLTLRALRRVLRATDRDTRLLATTTGLTPSQLGVLQEVGRHSALPPTSIASATGISPANVTAIVDRLVAKGLVVRQRGHVDRRQILVSLTDSGRTSGWNPLRGLSGMLSSIVSVFQDPGNTQVILFSAMVGSLIALTQRSGGIDGFVSYIMNKSWIKGRKGAHLLAWGLGIVIFIESSIKILIVGSVCRRLQKLQHGYGGNRCAQRNCRQVHHDIGIVRRIGQPHRFAGSLLSETRGQLSAEINTLPSFLAWRATICRGLSKPPFTAAAGIG